jgi:hypothetical protein
MKIYFFFFLLTFFFSCTVKQQKKTALPQTAVTAKPVVINYDSCKNKIAGIKRKNKTGWSQLLKAEKEKIFTAAMVQTIIPGWIGTPWDFNGTSETPQQGAIACGYFVTTVLRDGGLNLARVKLAQCASEQMLTTLIQPKYIQRFSNVSIQNFVAAVQQQGYGLYIVGLDNHTGFIYNDGASVYFIHSTFVGSRNVQKENAATSMVLRQSKYKVLGKLSADEKVLERWMERQ